MTDVDKLTSLYERLTAEQHRLLDVAASQQVVPTDNMLRQIAAIESTLTAITTMLEDAQQSGSRS